MDQRRADTLTDLVLDGTGFASTGTTETAATEGDTADGSGHATADHATADHATADHATADHATADHATADHATADHATADHATADRAASDGAGPAPAPAAEETVVLPVAPAPSRLPGVAPAGGCRAGRTTVSVQIRVTVPLDTLQGHSDEPGELVGYGPITAPQARELAADPDSIWRRLVTDPLSGALLDVGTTRYRPPPSMTEHVVARHQYCQYPGCRIPAHRCDLDHNIPYDPRNGTGPTSTANLGPKCRPHHRLKGMRGWSVIQYEDGSILWITPSGHTYLVEPPPAAEIRAPLPSETDDEPVPF